MQKIILILIFIFSINLHAQIPENFINLFKNQEIKSGAKFLIKYLPYYDRLNFNKKIFLENIRYAYLARFLMPWGGKIPEKIFLNYVLPHRVTQEPIESWRKIFFETLGEKVHNLSMKKAVLFISRWCYEKAVYKPTMPWDSGPVDILKLEYGRCEEKAILLICALRSVCIPARLVFTPGWLHANGNHAWVEVWIDGKWHVLEIAKPVKKLDEPWFKSNYSLMPAVYAYSYSDGFVNITPRYNPKICLLKIKTKNKAYISIFNSGMMRIVGVYKGKSIALGFGDYLIIGENRFNKVSCFSKKVTVKLKPLNLNFKKLTFTFHYPEKLMIKTKNIYPEKFIAEVDKKRELKLKILKEEINEKIKNRDLRKKFLLVGPYYREFLKILNKKDVIDYLLELSPKDIVRLRSKEILNDIKIANLTKRNYYSRKIFVKYVLNPRIYFENLMLWREEIFNKYKKLRDKPVNSLINLAIKIVNNYRKINKKDYGPMLTPLNVVESESYRNDIEAKVAIVAILRTFGVPAKFNYSTEVIYVYTRSGWIALEKLKNLKISWKDILNKCPKKSPKYDRDYTVAYFKNGYFHSIRFMNVKFFKKKCASILHNLPDKNYYLIYGKRDKNSTKVIFYNLHSTIPSSSGSTISK